MNLTFELFLEFSEHGAHLFCVWIRHFVSVRRLVAEFALEPFIVLLQLPLQTVTKIIEPLHSVPSSLITINPNQFMMYF